MENSIQLKKMARRHDGGNAEIIILYSLEDKKLSYEDVAPMIQYRSKISLLFTGILKTKENSKI